MIINFGSSESGYEHRVCGTVIEPIPPTMRLPLALPQVTSQVPQYHHLQVFPTTSLCLAYNCFKSIWKGQR